MEFIEHSIVCDHCGALAGKPRPVGKYMVKLYAFENEAGVKLFCITCLKHFKKLDADLKLKSEQSNTSSGFFEGLMAFYKKKGRVVPKDSSQV